MRILFAGNWQFSIYEQACADALSRQGVIVLPFAWDRYFKGLSGRAQHKFPLPGPALLRLNRDLIEAVRTRRPDCIWVWRGTHILPRTLRKLKQETDALLVSYNNDDPFGPKVHGNVPRHHHFQWCHYLNAIPEYDLHLVYRPVNISEILKAGAKEAHVLMPYFIPEEHHPFELTNEEMGHYTCDVVFVGHYEPDRREQYLKALVRSGLRVRLFGGDTWTKDLLSDLGYCLGSVQPVFGVEYSKALCGAQMCLCFLSRLNRDTYTRRCFEIPACGRLLVSERTDDLRRLFNEDEEAVFFSSREELVEKALWLRDHPREIERIAQAGMRRVHADGHSVDDRMKQVLSMLERQSR